MAAKSDSSDDVDALATQFQHQCSVVNFTATNHNKKDSEESIPQIHTIMELSQKLPKICNAIYKTLGSQQTEATYQRCLAVDLQHAGLQVEMEVEILLLYKSQQVGTRRADLVVTLPKTKERAVLELKAVQSLLPSHAKQLQYYMHHLQVNMGYLVNFPHDSGFPSVETDDVVFEYTNLGSSDDSLDVSTLDATQKVRHDPNRTESPSQVQVVQVQQYQVDSEKGRLVMGRKEQQRLATKQQEPQQQEAKTWGITSGGTPCRLCQEEQGYCHFHVHQKETKADEIPTEKKETRGCTVS